MAAADDTAAFCPNDPNEHSPTNPLGRPFYASDDSDDPTVVLRGRLAGISMAINVLTGLLANNESLRDAFASSADLETDAPPLPPTCVEGLLAALHFLSLYGESLSYRLAPETVPAC